MEKNGMDHNCMERASDFLVSSNIVEELGTGDQMFQPLSCQETKDPSFGENAVLPITAPVPQDDASPLNIPMQLSQPLPFCAEEFHLVDQSGHSLYEVQSLEGSNTHMMIVASQSENGQVLHVIPSTQPGMAQVIIPQSQLLDVFSSQDVSEEKNCDENLRTVAVAAIADNTSSYILHPRASRSVSKKPTTCQKRILEDIIPVSPQPLPPNTPTWAHCLRSCEKIGDSFRGYCSSETELESVLTLHKQQTHSVWGTRQSPSPAKPTSRLMWKSQYVPYDGIPFVNTGSRAIVMECQYGPRRKGFQPRKTGEPENVSCQLYKATCPARIYIKKVQKFPEYRVPTDIKIDKKVIRMEQEKAFNMLKKNLIDAGGLPRWYVQLPTQQAHQYHEMEEACLPPSPIPFSVPSPEEEDDTVRDENCILPSRLHPQVADKIKELVLQGIEQVYAVRKQLRKFVERELFKHDEVPERHNLSFFPTVNDIKNHIHEVQKTLKNGKIEYNSETIPAMLQWTTDGGNILTETVTVSFASPSAEGSSPEKATIKVESDQAKELLCPETAQLLSSLQPRVFAQLKGLQLQQALASTDGAAALITVDSHSPFSPAHSIGRQMISQRTIYQSHNLQASFTQNKAAASVLEEQPVSDQRAVAVSQVVTAGSIEDTEVIEPEAHLLDAQTVDSRATLRNPESATCSAHVTQEAKEQAVSLEMDTFRDFHASSAT
ncbi:calcium-responsive transcription factor isoform X2 [Tiliqua scincoides]